MTPFVVAHRAGNDLRRLALAERLPVAMVEADLHLHRERLEVRHLKTAGPLPVLWDRWTLASARAPRLLVDRLLATARPRTHLMLDLKGTDRRLAGLLAERITGRRLTVCSRSWALLDAVRWAPEVRVVHSVGSRRQLAALRRRLRHGRLPGVSIHRRLLTPMLAAELAAQADVVMTWPVTGVDDALRLASWGVGGVITEDYARLAGALGVTEEARAA